MAQRSKHYDWFKGPNYNKDPRENFKAKAKTIWKFTKIFLYFSLFFFSMWGCVQVFTHKLDTRPAAGITFSNGDGNLSPQVRRFKLVDDSNRNLYLKGPEITYMSSKNKGEKKVIDNVNRQLKNDLGVSSPTKARKGGNYVIILQDQNGNFIGEKDNLVLTSKIAPNKAKTLLYTTASIDQTNANYYSFEKSKEILRTLAPRGFRRYLYQFDEKQKNVIKITKTQLIKVDDLLEQFKGKLSPRQELAFYFNVNVLKTLFDKVNQTRSAANQISFEQQTFFKKDAILNSAETTNFLKREQNINFFLNLIFEKGQRIEASKIQLLSSPVGFFANSKWIPITTWGKAWDKDGGMGPFYGIFVYPIAFITNEIIHTIPNLAGWESLITIVIIVVTLSVLMFALNFKNTLQQTKMQELSAKKAIIDAKYAPYKGNKQMENRQRQEVATLYKKEGISPLSQIGSLFLRMPFFLAMWRVIGSIDHIKATEWIGINFATTSWRALLGNLSQWNNGWAYFPLILVAVGSQFFSTMLPRMLTKRRNKNRMNVQQREAMKKSDRTQKIIMVVTLIFPLITSAGVQIYFIIRSVWTIFEQLITHQLLVKRKKRLVARGSIK